MNITKFFLDKEYFLDLDTNGVNNNVIEIGYLEYGITSNNTEKNPITLSLQGVPYIQTTIDYIDDITYENSFIYITKPNNLNVIKLIVSKTEIDTIEKAEKYITGILLEYKNAQVSLAGTTENPLYQLITRRSDRSVVGIFKVNKLEEVLRKTQVLEKDLDINKVGRYIHEIAVSLVVN